jgi:HK97 family phage portal protein
MLNGLKRFFEKRSVPSSTFRDPDWWVKDAFHINRTDSGVDVTPETSLRTTAVFACVRVLSESMAGLPLHVYERLADGGRQRNDQHPLYRVLHSQPNPLQTSFEWRQLAMAHLLLYGNSFHEIVRNAAGDVEAIYPMHPSRVILKLQPDGSLVYQYNGPIASNLDPYFQISTTTTMGSVLLQPERVLHLKGLSTDGFLGLSPITAARQSIGLTMAAEKYGAGYFGRGARLGGWLEMNPGAPQLKKDQREQIQDAFGDAYAGPENAHKIAVLSGGMTFKPFDNTNDDSQFLETRQFQVADIARIFRVPPHMIGDLSKATYSNIAQQSLEFCQYSLLPWVCNLEQAFAAKLLRPEERNAHFPEFDLNGLQRGDQESRMRAYQAGIYAGIYSPNECRAFENLNPRDGGDTYLQPTNLAPSPYLPAPQQGAQQ